MRTWFITGISRGFGKALAETLLARGGTVIGTVREGAPDIDAGAGTLHVLPLEITDAASVAATVAQAFALSPRIDVVVNNAGYGLLGAFEDASDADIARLFEVNVFGPMRVIRAALPHLRAQGSGHIVNITSIAGRAPNPGSGVYAAAKSAMEGLSNALALELQPTRIKVLAVAPGAFRTDFLSDHSIRVSEGGSVDAYAETAGKVVAGLGASAGRQIGDPQRGVEAIIAAVEADAPPRQLLLGSDALRRWRVRHDVEVAEIEQWEAITLGTDFPAADEAATRAA